MGVMDASWSPCSYKTRSRRTKTALFVGKPRYRQSQPTEFLATTWGAHNSHAEDDERNAKASLPNADSIDLHRLTCIKSCRRLPWARFRRDQPIRRLAERLSTSYTVCSHGPSYRRTSGSGSSSRSLRAQCTARRAGSSAPLYDDQSTARQQGRT